MEKSQFFKISLEIQNEIMTPKSEFGSRVKFFFWKFSLEMIEFILIRNPNEILRVKLSKLGFHFQNFIPYKKRPQQEQCFLDFQSRLGKGGPSLSHHSGSFSCLSHHFLQVKSSLKIPSQLDYKERCPLHTLIHLHTPKFQAFLS